MDTTLSTLNDFFTFCQIHSCLKDIADDNHVFLHDEIMPFLKKSKTIVKKSLGKKCPLQDFYKKNNFKLIDLELLYIALLEQTKNVSLEKYMQKSIFENFDKTQSQTAFLLLQQSQLIKEGYLALENNFVDKKVDENANQKDILALVTSAKAEKSKKLDLTFKQIVYKDYSDILKDLHLLDKIFITRLDGDKGISKVALCILYDAYYSKIVSSYNTTLQTSKKDFSVFLKKYKVTVPELILFSRHVAHGNDFGKHSLNVSEQLQDKYKNGTIMERLVKKNLLKKYDDWFEPSAIAIKKLLGVEKEIDEDTIAVAEKPTQTFSQLCIDDTLKQRIMSAIDQYKHKELIFTKWGLASSIGYGRGITLNFSGPPGTGKTLAVRVIANYLGKKLHTINYAQIKDKYVGETEKNIRLAFKNAYKDDAVLFFDEADSLTTKREHAHASWEVSQTNTLLKELENFEGVCIFATNFAQSYDEAFNRRLSAHIEFTLPGKDELVTIFNIHFPKKKALAYDVDFNALGALYAGIFSGGDVKNAVLNAARIAAQEGCKKIFQRHIVDACNLVHSGKGLVCERPNYYG